MKRKNNLDERQEQLLLKIEHNGVWLAFWGLLAAILIQQLAFGWDFKHIAGEWMVFMVLAIYLFSACMKNGIWDRHLIPSGKTNAKVSLIAAVISGVVIALSVSLRYDTPVRIAAVSGGVTAVLIFVLCFAALTVSAARLKKKQKELEAEPEEE